MRACPGLFTDEHDIRYHLPQERGWAYVHRQMLADGLPTQWPNRADNPDGRWWTRLLAKWQKHKAQNMGQDVHAPLRTAGEGRH